MENSSNLHWSSLELFSSVGIELLDAPVSLIPPEQLKLYRSVTEIRKSRKQGMAF